MHTYIYTYTRAVGSSGQYRGGPGCHQAEAPCHGVGRDGPSRGARMPALVLEPQPMKVDSNNRYTCIYVHVDVDTDVDIDMDIDAEIDVDVEINIDVQWLQQVGTWM